MSRAASRPALGQVARIGTLYTATTDSFLSSSVFKDDLPAGSILQNPAAPAPKIQINYVDKYQDKFDMMGINAELGASILAGFVEAVGSGRYLTEECNSDKRLKAAILLRYTTFQEKLNFRDAELSNSLSITSLRASEATHVVTGIEWGCQNILTVEHRLADNEEMLSVQPQFRAEVEALKSSIESTLPVSDRNNITLDLVAYTDTIQNTHLPMGNFQDVAGLIELTSSFIDTENDGKGKVLTYTLMPVTTIAELLAIDLDDDVSPIQPSAECLRRFVQLFDQLHFTKKQLNDHQSFLRHHKHYVGDGPLEAVSNRLQALDLTIRDKRQQFSQVLKSVRTGQDDPEALWQLLRASDVQMFSEENTRDLLNGPRDSVEFIESMVSQGATYIGFNGMELKAELSRHRKLDSFVLFFSYAARHNELSWQGNQELMLELLRDKENKKYFAIVDCDALGMALEKAHIMKFKDRKEVINDVLEQRQFLAEKCFARCIRGLPEETDTPKPVKRRLVKIGCPGSGCDRNEVRDWLCSNCHTSIEYGYSDDYIYCECGRSPYYNYEFKCNGEHHGSGYHHYDQDMMDSLLKSLDSSGYLNILILGETGVGKSTFINAFVNYLTFGTLDDAMKAEKLQWVIPCSFCTQVMNRSDPDSQIRQIEVKVGGRYDERDGSQGESATQQTTVYPVTIGSTTIRLIDTPGIGDTRGIEYDRKNMADILATLNSYEELHGILILLKSNNSRLTVTFRFCVQELLIHLHRTATNNMAFGFTNTRISNYTPGDTFKPLEALLAKHPNMGLGLSTHTTYCFDSESFRFLAAYKNGTTMENIEDFRRSWEHSRKEAWRLVDYFKTLPPHDVSSTISLNSTRELVTHLTKPMADISQLIQKNIAVGEDKAAELTTTRLTGHKLRQRLHMQKIQLKSVALDKPRTVCCASSCTEYKDDGNGENKVVTVYKSHCHKVCYLKDVRADQIAHPGLIHCTAFRGSNFCNHCTHHWNEHMHVLYELKEETVTVVDTEIERQLEAHADDMTLRETAVYQFRERIKEYENEHKQIQKAAAKFCIFLKKHSITLYNDATIEYLDMLIKEEKGKVQAGGNRRRLDALEQDRLKHLELVKALTCEFQQNPSIQPLTDGGVTQLVQELYSLKHFGQNLKSVKTTVTAAHKATYRERPYRVPSFGGWKAFSGVRKYAEQGTRVQPSHQSKTQGLLSRWIG